MVTLTKASEHWVVSYDTDFQMFSTIEAAAQFLVQDFGIEDEEIDEALVEMAGFDRLKALFVNGRLQETK